MHDRDWGWPETAVLDRAWELLGTDHRTVLATVVAVDGSAYRRPGAKRLIGPETDSVGSLTPGCLEAQARRIREAVLEAGEPRTETFDLGGGDSWGLGVGCDGTVEVLFEPLGDGLRDALETHALGERCGVLTIVDSDDADVAVGDRATVRDGITPVRGAWPTWLRDRVSEAEAVGQRAVDTVPVAGPIGDVIVFVDWLVSAPRLAVLGTGNDVRPLVELGTRAGFRVVVVGFRDGAASTDRFPGAETVTVGSPGDLPEAVDVDGDTYAVLATHNLADDRLALAELFETDAPYIGLVGSRDRAERIVEALDSTLLPTDRERLYAPAGLDVGGGAPTQVALSIVSEVLAVHNDRSPRHLRERSGPIHERL